MSSIIRPFENVIDPALASVDPITAILQRDWATASGWSLFVLLCILIVTSFMRGWIVPGTMYRRLEDASKLQSETLSTTAAALDKQVTANQIVEHFFKETTPRRGEVDTS